MSNKNTSDNFNADERAKRRESAEITIGGQKFKPRRRTVDLMDEWAEAAPASAGAAEFDKSDPIAALREFNKQLVVLLVDEEENAPAIEFLNKHLDVDDAWELLDKLSPDLGGNLPNQPKAPSPTGA